MNWSIPVQTEWMRSQAGHEPSMQYAKDIYKVASKLKDFTALEIGAAWGLSTLAILEAGAKHLTSVDPNIMAEGQNEAIANGYDITWYQIKSEVFWKEHTEKFDLIYIDGSHLYEDVKNDLYEGWEHLNDGGILMADDWQHPKNIVVEGNQPEYGVSLACFEFWSAHEDEIKDVNICGRVLWFRK